MSYNLRLPSGLTYGQMAVQSELLTTNSDVRNGGTTTFTRIYVDPTGVAPYNDGILLRNAGWNVTCEETGKGPEVKMTATYPQDLFLDPNGTYIPTIQWDIEPYVIDQSILECTDRAFIASLSTATKGCIENAVKYPVGTAGLVPSGSAYLSQLPAATTAYNLKMAGVESKQIYGVTLKRTIVVPTNLSMNWSLVNNNYVLSTSYLISYYAIPNWIQWQLPAGNTAIQSDINGITTFYGWLETPPHRTNIGFNRCQIGQTWTYGKWSVGANGLYDVII